MPSPTVRTRPIVLVPGLAERFWAKVDKRGPDECWMWRGAATRGGYGVLAPENCNTFVRSHRLSLLLATGVDPIGLMVCHRCDVPGCVNPSHLFTGTAADNVRDMDAKGRRAPHKGHAPTIGEQVWSSKLNPEAVRDIRARSASGATSTEIAKLYGMDSSSIRYVVRRDHWKHVA